MNRLKVAIFAVALASVTLAMAQPTDLIRERTPVPPLPPPPPEADGLLERSVERQAQLAVKAERVAEARAQADVQRKMLLAQSGGGSSSAFGAGARPRSPRALIIPKDAGDAKSLGEVEEDLGVMAHILDKAVSGGGDKAARAMGIAVFSKFPGAATAPQNLYIEGHGAIFLLNVNYPLLPPPAKVNQEETKEPVNNEWEEARRELARPGKSPAGGDPFELFEERFGADAAWNVNGPSPEYNADKVEDLKRDVISALKNAANIRRLKADESVTVVIIGAEAGVVTKTFKSTESKSGGSKTERAVMAKATAGERTRVGDSAKLVIQARKADAEAFQNGKLDFEAFQKKASVLIF